VSGEWPDTGTSSLTGHILRQGRPDTDPGDGHGRRGVKIGLGVIAAVALLSLIIGLLVLTSG
jgi:hypothetical protein